MPLIRVIRIATWLVITLLATTAIARDYRHESAGRVVAMSDPHGAYDSMLRTLGNAGIVDDAGNWAGSDATLVITGDLLDRGADSRRIMDLVMRLEAQAPEAGGNVLLTLGNHEVMNLVGDLRYVAAGEYAAFADEETAAERQRWFDVLLATRRMQVEGELDEALLRAEFDRARPPGFYAHRRAFSSEGKYGKWLLEKPLMVVVDDSAFVHGGMPAIVAELGLEGLNDRMRAEIRDYVVALEKLFDADLIDPAVNFYEHGRIAEGILAAMSENPLSEPELIDALDKVVSLNNGSVHASDSPLWYRGTVGCSELTEGDVIAEALAAVGARRVAIGHTPTVTRRVLERFDGRVIEIDTGMLSSAYKGSGFALVIEGDNLLVAEEHSAELSAPVRHPRRVGERADSLTSEVLTELLRDGDIVSSNTDDSGRTVVEISRNGATVSALFAESPRRGEPELAAYHLDRMIGLDIVPVTVAREVDGERGTLQFLPKNARDEAYRSGSGQGGGAWCPLGRQWSSLYVFDALIHNKGRLPTTMVYSTANWHLMSMGHAAAFGTERGRPRYLQDQPLLLTSTWVDALNGLTEENVQATLGEWLTKRQVSALLNRRDQLLEDAAP